MDVLDKVRILPPDKQQEVEDFIDYLISKYNLLLKPLPINESLEDLRKANSGWAKGQIWIAADFNETPEDFKDYL
jgi:hypothetical protein